MNRSFLSPRLWETQSPGKGSVPSWGDRPIGVMVSDLRSGTCPSAARGPVCPEQPYCDPDIPKEGLWEQIIWFSFIFLLFRVADFPGAIIPLKPQGKSSGFLLLYPRAGWPQTCPCCCPPAPAVSQFPLPLPTSQGGCE